MVHVVFALHLYTFLLLTFCAAMLVAKLSEWTGAGGLESPTVDLVISVILFAACALYLYLAIGPVYQVTGLARLAQAIVLAIAVGSIVLGYRFVLFLITLYGT